MALGDYHQTAVAVAWAVGMVPPGGIVHVIDKVPRAWTFSPPTSPVQVASTGMLFPRDAKERPPFSRLQSTKGPAHLRPRSSHFSQAETAVSANRMPSEVLFNLGGLDRALLTAKMRKLAGSQIQAEQSGEQRGEQTMVNISPVPSAARQPTLSALELPDTLDLSAPSRADTVGPEHFRLQCEGLKFSLGFGAQDVREDTEAINAMTSIAKGDTQCAITGAAFEHLLQQEDLSILEAVLQNAVVFARMRPHQK